MPWLLTGNQGLSYNVHYGDQTGPAVIYLAHADLRVKVKMLPLGDWETILLMRLMCYLHVDIFLINFVRTFWMEGFTRTEPPLSRALLR